jgi:hypothetical protein
MRRLLFVLVLLILLGTACAPNDGSAGPGEESAPTPTAEPANTEELPAPTKLPVDLTPAQLAALNTLAEKLNVSPDKITVISTEAVTWPDGCLGIVRMGVMCTQAEVPGFKIVLEADGQKYEIHTDEDGSVALMAEGAQSAGEADRQVIKQLAANLDLQESEISVVSSKPVEFGDVCLGVAMEGMDCAQVVTPGNIIVLEANGVQYEYHVSADGSRVQPATFALVWKREGGIAGFCDALNVFRSGEVYTSSCKSQAEGSMDIITELLTTREREQFNAWLADFGNVQLDASDPQGVSDRMVVTLEVFGSGTGEPTDSEQKALFEFAQNLYQKMAQ